MDTKLKETLDKVGFLLDLARTNMSDVDFVSDAIEAMRMNLVTADNLNARRAGYYPARSKDLQSS